MWISIYYDDQRFQAPSEIVDPNADQVSLSILSLKLQKLTFLVNLVSISNACAGAVSGTS